MSQTTIDAASTRTTGAQDLAAQDLAVQAPAATGAVGVRHPLLQSLSPLLVDAGVPIASYYLLSSAFGLSDLAALAWSSALPAVRTVWGLAGQRRFNAMAVLMLTTNVVGLLLSLVVGDPRLMIAKDSGVSSTVGIAFLCSALVGRPLLSAALKPWLTRGGPAELAAWERLSTTCPRFQRAERRFTAVWGAALLTECVLRVIGAYTLPVHTMVWLGTVLLLLAVVSAIVVSGRVSVHALEELVDAEAARG
ncbi:VC0807 family protein [Goodfellowiella coeruleoviolacea]|uniref:DUF3159 domain-containing protein n=1 Tax=Goodfellowiella coeruleoviolacea TaxID=334858 RepID=A0AAE3KQ15_9PSEU|nr:VC0807 family protein [Goodfellowiella coeruleoviolacea]MCP2170468.1 hypothetical protein [Goodfellowiella coeruleoviolacea]